MFSLVSETIIKNVPHEFKQKHGNYNISYMGVRGTYRQTS